MPERTISLSYPATCRICGRPLPKDTTARWDTTTRAVACERCPAVAATTPITTATTLHAAPVTSTPSDRQPAGRPVTPQAARWQQLVGYHLLAVQRQSVAEPVPVAQGAAWLGLELPAEELITGRADELVLDTRSTSLFTRVSSDQAVYYGWPTVVVADRTQRLHIAPLLVTALRAAPDGATASPSDDAPYVNPGLLTEAFFPAEVLAAALACLPEQLPFGDVDGMRIVAATLLGALGFDAATIDPHHLTATIARPPRGTYNAAMLFRGASDRSTRSLIEELAELRSRRDWEQTAAAWLMSPPRATTDTDGSSTAPGDAARPSGLPPLSADGLRLNDSQEQAIEAALTRHLTVVTGPPGTGKSQLVAAVVINQWITGNKVLVASTNNEAVKVAVTRCAEVDPALLIRTGNREARDELPSTLEALAVRTTTAGPSPDLVRRRLEMTATRRTQLLEKLTARTKTESELAQVVIDREELRRLLWGNPEQGPAHDGRGRIHRAALAMRRSRWLRSWRARRLLKAASPTASGVRADDVARWAETEARADALCGQLERMGSGDPKRERAELEAADQEWAQASTAALRDVIGSRLHAGRAALQQRARLRTAGRAAHVAATVRAQSFTPAWACTTLSAQANFPLTAGMFDLLIIDEASQCSIAQVLPLAYRARRILIVGDPNQLTPIVTLGSATLHDLAAAVGTTSADVEDARVSVGKDSTFTAYAARSPVVPLLLNQHYRCHPEVARWFNNQFYEGALRVLTAVDTVDPRPRGLHLLDVPGLTLRSAAGGTFNEVEADAITSWIAGHEGPLATVGVVTPFAAQVTHIRRRLRQELGDAAEAVAVGTAHAFQGGERDTIVFSATLAAEARSSTARWVESQRNLINVAASRSRRALVVVADVTAIEGLPVPTLQALVHAAGGRVESGALGVEEALREDADLHSEAERRVYAALHRSGVRAEPKLVVEGYELDFAIRASSRLVDVEIDGIHHTDVRGRQRRQDLARDRILGGLGWQVMRFPAWMCLTGADQVAADVRRVVAGESGV